MNAYGESRPLGHQRPRISHLQPGIGTLGREAVELAALAGLELDPWQQWVLEQSLTQSDTLFYNKETKEWQNKWAAKDVGLVVARQNGKGSILEARELAGLFLLGEKTIIHSAQDFATSGEHYRRLESLIRGSKQLEAEVKGFYQSNGKEAIELKNGSRIVFKTRTAKLGRGFSPQLVVLDEAMFLDETAMAALLPTLSAQDNPQIWYTGSAGTLDSTEFGRVRNRALSGDDPFLFFAEWSIDACDIMCPLDCTEHDDPTTVESYAKANPGLGIRISVDTVRGEQLQMSKEKFLRERLSVGTWPEDSDMWGMIPEKMWKAVEDPTSEIKTKFVLGVDTNPERTYTTIVAAGGNDDELTHAEITADEEGLHYRPGIQWVVPMIKAIALKGRPVCVVIDKASQAGTFIPELEDAGIEVVSPLAREYAQACGDFHGAVVPKRGEETKLAHLGQMPLYYAVAGAGKRDLADGWAWSRANSTSDISPLVAATLAMWGYKKHVFEKKAVAPWIARR